LGEGNVPLINKKTTNTYLEKQTSQFWVLKILGTSAMTRQQALEQKELGIEFK
jgi:hypothetical protein